MIGVESGSGNGEVVVVVLAEVFQRVWVWMARFGLANECELVGGGEDMGRRRRSIYEAQ